MGDAAASRSWRRPEADSSLEARKYKGTQELADTLISAQHSQDGSKALSHLGRPRHMPSPAQRCEISEEGRRTHTQVYLALKPLLLSTLQPCTRRPPKPEL